MKKIGPYLLIIAGLAVFYWYYYKHAPSLEFAHIQLMLEDGSTISLDKKLEGKTVVHFYASWCGPCLAEMRDIKAHFEKLKTVNMHFLVITDDKQEQMEKMKSDMPDEIEFCRIASLKEIGIRSLPATYFMMGSEVIFKKVESLDWSNQSQIEELFSN